MLQVLLAKIILPLLVNPMTSPGDMIYDGTYGSDLAVVHGIASSNIGTSGHVASYAIDGNDSTYWYANDTAGKYLVVDLQAPYAVVAFRVLGYDSYQNYTISSSNDGVTYTDRWVGSSSSGWPDAGIQDAFQGAVTARYWRLLTTSGSGGYFGVETFQLLPPPSPVALSIGAPGQVLTVSGGIPTWQAPSSTGGPSFWNQLAGALSPVNIGDDLLLGATSTTSAPIAFTGLMGNQTQASISGNFVLMPNNGWEETLQSPVLWPWERWGQLLYKA